MSSPYRPSINEELARFAYSSLWMFILPVALCIWLIKSLVKPTNFDYRKKERFGFLPQLTHTGGIYLHCVSVGEVVAASKIVKSIWSTMPDKPITISTTTPTGADRVAQIFGDKVQHVYLPFDLPFLMQNLLNKVQPEQVLITEVELWPNLTHACWKRAIPVTVVNARMTDKSRRNYAKISALFTPMLHKISCVCAQGRRDFDNYLALGLPKDKLTLTNNIKFDLHAPLSTSDIEKVKARFNSDNRLIIIGGSTHAPEEQYLLDTLLALKKEHAIRLILVPRHPQRFDKVWALCQRSGLTCCRSSEANIHQSDIVLVDEMGVLAQLYGIADIAFIGGSIANRGGHNALEASIYGVPAIMGPHTYNNPEICQTLEDNGGLIICKDLPSLIAQCDNWLHDTRARQTAGQASARVIQENTGAIQRTLTAIGF
ncbi:3-deoxy-D-manno-octulosonic acid transferase [Aestuariibacter sp. AA17]|uniref:3-deoxy-D-manno-octulosonic acid transferase n=1 Tax=Fluctibacter corallii TaxID=2984329 RepID=A0ABT3ACY8_9ALTE|nr:3-deoxy-D-manno-octulosonic acid transferase [Aestuariibacter sp. AA17]MCV2886162.1 3-deoxy-D-manno-octulosonic acid transferase [Aestuariibacter sp. AA17]